MQFAIVEEGETLVKLARRIYCACSEPELERAVEALRGANRGFESTGQLTAGTVVMVPTVKGLAPTESVQTAGGTAAAVLESLRKQLGDLGSALDPGLRQLEVQAEASLKLVQSSEVRNLERQDAVIRERLGKVAEASKARLESAKKLRELNRQAFVELDADLDGLLRMLGSTADRAARASRGSR